MIRRQRTIRGVDDDAWEMLQEMRDLWRIEMGALLSNAIRYWYSELENEPD